MIELSVQKRFYKMILYLFCLLCKHIITTEIMQLYACASFVHHSVFSGKTAHKEVNGTCFVRGSGKNKNIIRNAYLAQFRKLLQNKMESLFEEALLAVVEAF